MEAIRLSALLRPDVRRRVLRAVRSGHVFIYPTDTVYGIGCLATSARAVARVRRIKGTSHPFSVIAPTKAWIRRHLIVPKRHAHYLKLLPGPYTLIFRKRRNGFLKQAASAGALGVRMPGAPFCQLLMRSGIAFITTSANLSGRPVVKGIADLPPRLQQANIAIDAGQLPGKASKVIDLTGGKPLTLRK